MIINFLETNTTSNNYIESMLLSGFTQHLAKPTRVTLVSKTLLDHVFHNNILQNTYDVINLYKSIYIRSISNESDNTILSNKRTESDNSSKVD